MLCQILALSLCKFLRRSSPGRGQRRDEEPRVAPVTQVATKEATKKGAKDATTHREATNKK